REAAGLRQQDLAPHIARADDPARHISDALLSQIEAEAVRLPRGFSALHAEAIRRAAAERRR
ncbi:MAG: hypothetical protein NUW01_03755, partial [Gemmatimonadaceae bacterium]|nr:hypothetical protein [Gemmatimonadaceae bacterium]